MPRKTEKVVSVEKYSFNPIIGSISLKDVSFEINRGEIVGILGDVFSGKEFVVQALNRIVPKEIAGQIEGKIIVEGMDLEGKEIVEVAPHLGLVFRNPVTQILAVTVAEDVAFGPSNLGIPTEEIWERIHWALESVRLAGYEDRNPMSLSGGELQSLAIADILAMQPNTIAMDEPLAMLDPLGANRVLTVVQGLNKEKNITFVITESGATVESLAEYVTRLIYMDRGEVKIQGSPGEVLAADVVKNVGIPQVTELFLRLRKLNPSLKIPVKLGDAVNYLRKEMKGKKINPDLAAEIVEKKKTPRRDSEALVTVRNLHHVYPAQPEPVRALNGLGFDIRKGELVGLIGQNGSGKTTLSMHLVGILNPTNDDAEIKVGDVDIVSEPERAKLEINYVFQNPDNQMFNETVYEEIAWGLRQREMSEDEVDRRVTEELKAFDLEDYRDEYIILMPRGVKTRAAIASITALNPKAVIIDEPTGGLDWNQSTKMMNTLLSMNKELGRTMVVITHDMKIVAQYTEYVIALRKGEILLQGSTREVFSQTEKLSEAWLQPPQITLLGQRLSEFGFPDCILTVDEMYELMEASKLW